MSKDVKIEMAYLSRTSAGIGKEKSVNIIPEACIHSTAVNKKIT